MRILTTTLYILLSLMILAAFYTGEDPARQTDSYNHAMHY